jgi:hypothetical protein
MISIYNNGLREATTSKVAAAKIKKELMREFTLDFTLYNSDPARKFIKSNSELTADGQRFDIARYNQSSGNENLTAVTAYHVSYRLNNYILPAGYSFLGTVAQIAADILDKSLNGTVKASTEFTVGTCHDVGSQLFNLNNEQEVTARYAIIAMKELGIEVEYDNFTLNFPEIVGGETHNFEFGVNLVDFKRTWDKSNGATYDVSIANLQRLPDYSGLPFEVGDYANVIDTFIGDTVQKRIITYTKDLLDPTQDSITLGVFIRDSASQATEVKQALGETLKEGQAYSKCTIDRTNGFMSVRDDGEIKCVQNGEDCFAIYEKLQDGTFRKVAGLAGKRVFVSQVSNEENTNYYAVIGYSDDGSGLELYSPEYGGDFNHFKIVRTPTQNFTFVSGHENFILSPMDGNGDNYDTSVGLYDGSVDLIADSAKLTVDDDGVHVFKNNTEIWHMP